MLVMAHFSFIRNVTPSEPLGIYLLLPQMHVTIARGDFVLACEPESAERFAERHGFILAHSWLPLRGCPSERLLIKEAWGIEGDRMKVTRAGVTRNGTFIPRSRPRSHLGDGTALPRADVTTITAGNVWVGSHVEKSFDSRYFGQVPILARLIYLHFDI